MLDREGAPVATFVSCSVARGNFEIPLTYRAVRARPQQPPRLSWWDAS